MLKYARKKTLTNGLSTISNCILLWNTSIWHNDVFYVHIIIYLKLQLSTTGNIRELSSLWLVQSASWLVRKLTSPRDVQSASWLVRKLSSPRDVQSASWQSASWHIWEFSSYLMDCYSDEIFTANSFLFLILSHCLQCFDAVGCTAERASSL